MARIARMNMIYKGGKSTMGLGQEARRIKARAKATKVEVKAMDSPEAVDAAEMAGKVGRPVLTSG